MTVYHFTDVGHLPWIAATSELRPGRNRVGGYPVDFLWATTNPHGDRTATCMPTYRAGLPLVRFTLRGEDFEPWPRILDRFPQWTPEQVGRLEAFAREKGQAVSGWKTRAEPLPLSQVIKVETKRYTGRWQMIDLNTACLQKGKEHGVLIDNIVYWSKRCIEPDAPAHYAVRETSLAEWNEI
jgi:hypothetical protein